MAKSHARIRKTSLTDSWKAKISASMIVNRLKDHMLGDCDMKPTQVQAAKILMDKLVSDAPTEITGAEGAPLLTGIEVRFVGSDSGVPK